MVQLCVEVSLTSVRVLQKRQIAIKGSQLVLPDLKAPAVVSGNCHVSQRETNFRASYVSERNVQSMYGISLKPGNPFPVDTIYRPLTEGGSVCMCTVLDFLPTITCWASVTSQAPPSQILALKAQVVRWCWPNQRHNRSICIWRILTAEPLTAKSSEWSIYKNRNYGKELCLVPTVVLLITARGTEVSPRNPWRSGESSLCSIDSMGIQ